MVTGLFFNEKHSFRDLKLKARIISRPILPASKDQYVEIPGRAGSILFPDTLSDRMITIEFTFFEKNIVDIRKKTHEIANWLYTTDRKGIVFDDEPQYTYTGKVVNQIDLEEVAVRGRFNVTFRCLPFVTTTPDNYDEVYEYDTGLIYPNESGFIWDYATKHTSGLYNYTNHDTPLKITIQGAVSNIKISNIDAETSLDCPGIFDQTMVIDGENEDVTINGVSVLPEVTGDFPNLIAGSNGLIFEGGTRKNRPSATVMFEWFHQLL